MTTEPEKLDALLRRGVAEVLVETSVRQRLASGRPLRLKQGFDPTKPDLHIGHAVGLRKLRAFQDLGHQVVLIVGDWTAQIGDPSGRDETRPRLSASEVQRNAEQYMQQFFRVVDRSRTEVRWQSEWYGAFTLEQALGLLARFTLGQILAHETFRRRYDAGLPLTLLELAYPILQGYDSVVVAADIEFGGTDQKFNNLAGRELMGQLGMVPQDVLLVPLLPGTDGRKMGKSFNNTIDIQLAPLEMLSRVLSLSDAALPIYCELLTDIPLGELALQQAAIVAGQLNPLDLKKRLAREVVATFHSQGAAAQAEAEWVRRFSRREIPDDLPTHTLTHATTILDFLVLVGMAASKSAARRLIEGGGVRINGEKAERADHVIAPGSGLVVQVGRRAFVRVP